ncbi:hypothetical protein BDY24DRAFT_66327 [Mrakia frigida]|uniref:uncharacterized protein n=1 Tax=Mrakia frigida TaxID=29902 RepID=UPI003FCBF025
MRAARPLFLHHSALSPEEFIPFTLWLDELLPPPTLPTASSTRTTSTSISDQEALEALIRVDDVGRFLLEKLHVEEEVWEDVLSIFHPSHRSLQPRNSISQSHLRALPPLQGGECFVVFRLVGHSRLGKPVHIEGRKLAFWQAPPPLPSTESSSSSSASKPYPPPRSSTKPPPPPQHLARKNSSSAPSSVIGHRSTPSLSKELPPQVSPQPPPPLNPNPFRRGSQPSSVSPNNPLPANAKGGPSSSDSDGLRKVTGNALTVDSSPSTSSSEDEQGAEEVGRNHRRWQTPMSGREDSDSKHSGEGIRAGKASSSSSKSGGVQRSDTTESFLTVSSSVFSPLVAAKLGLSPHSSSAVVGGASPSSVSPLVVNVEGRQSPSSNPFRTRLDSAPGRSLPPDLSPISPLPPSTHPPNPNHHQPNLRNQPRSPTPTLSTPLLSFNRAFSPQRERENKKS